MMLIVSPAFDRVLREYSDEDKVPTDAREQLLAKARSVGHLRLLSFRENRGWKFREMDFDKFVNDKTFTVSESKLLSEIEARSGVGPLVPDDIWSRVANLRKSDCDPLQLCCGHDLVKLLAIALRRVWGTNNDAEVAPHRLERDLRIAYTWEDFSSTNLYRQLRAWEVANAPRRILAIVVPAAVMN